MNFGIFYEHQLPRPAGADWDDDAERRLYHEALEQVELADRVGIDCVWEVAFLGARGVPRGLLAAHQTHPAWPRHYVDATALQPPCPRR